MAAPAAHAGDLFSERFADGRTAPDAWSVAGPGRGGRRDVPCLTAGTRLIAGSVPPCRRSAALRRPDRNDHGALRLTGNTHRSAGAAVLNRRLAATAGLHLTFDLFMYRARSKRPGDGISFFLIDGRTRGFKAGTMGAGLGYKGVPGAIAGIGFDTYGNFSNPRHFGRGDRGPRSVPNSVVVRAGEHARYQYVGGVRSPRPLAVPRAKQRGKAKRSVAIDISTAGFMQVAIDYHDGAGPRTVLRQVDLNRIPGQRALPSTIRLGFAASTGGATDIHEIGDFRAAALPPDLGVALTGGQEGRVTATVANGAAAGPAGGKVDLEIPVPAGVTVKSATGSGWTCEAGAAKVSCSRPAGTPVRPAAVLPPVQLAFQPQEANSPGTTLTAAITTPGDRKLANNKAKALKLAFQSKTAAGPAVPAPGPAVPAPGPVVPAPGPAAPAPNPAAPAPGPAAPAPGPAVPAPGPSQAGPSVSKPNGWPMGMAWPPAKPADWPAGKAWPPAHSWEWPVMAPADWPAGTAWPPGKPADWPAGKPWPGKPADWPKGKPWTWPSGDGKPWNWPKGMAWPPAKPADWPVGKAWPPAHPWEWPSVKLPGWPDDMAWPPGKPADWPAGKAWPGEPWKWPELPPPPSGEPWKWPEGTPPPPPKWPWEK